MDASLDYRCAHGLLKSEPCRFCAEQTTVLMARQMFDAYTQALGILAGNFTTVAERRTAIHIRDEFVRDLPRCFRAVLDESDDLRQSISEVRPAVQCALHGCRYVIHEQERCPDCRAEASGSTGQAHAWENGSCIRCGVVAGEYAARMRCL